MKYRALLWTILLVPGCATARQSTTPSASTIARVESGYALLQDLSSVGVADSAAMNRAARVRVREVSCTADGIDAAICAYAADRCLEGESDPDGDGWCQRSARFVRVRHAQSPGQAAMLVRGWTVDRSPDGRQP
jgi:hypothetical protein